MENVQQMFRECIKEIQSNDYADIPNWIINYVRDIATQAWYTDAERGKLLRIFFQTLKEVNDDGEK